MQFLHFQVNITKTFWRYHYGKDIAKPKTYIQTHPFDSGSDACATVLEQIYLAYANSRESDPPEISESFKKLEEFLHHIPLSDNNAVCSLCCRLCGEYEHKAFIDGIQYGAHLITELKKF